VTHKRETIRKAVVSLLTADMIPGTIATGRIYSNRSRPLWEGYLPAINVTSDSEESERSDLTGGTSLERTLDLVVEATALDISDENLDDTLDDLAEEIESALGSDHTWGDEVTSSTLTATEFELDAGGEKPMGTVRLTYTVQYFTT